jgi:hypothetical protein
MTYGNTNPQKLPQNTALLWHEESKTTRLYLKVILHPNNTNVSFPIQKIYINLLKLNYRVIARIHIAS